MRFGVGSRRGRARRRAASRRKRGCRRPPAQPRSDAQRLPIEIFGQVGDAAPGCAVHRVDGASVGCRSDQISSGIPRCSEAEDFLRDEGLGQARIALDHDGDPAPSAPRMTALIRPLAHGDRRRPSRAACREARSDDSRGRRAGPERRPSEGAAGPAGRGAPRAMRAGSRAASSVAQHAHEPEPLGLRRRGCTVPAAGVVRGTIRAGLSSDRISQNVL